MPLSFDAFFEKATCEAPFPFQRAFATHDELPALVNIPTGLGKTAMAVVGWLWRRFEAGHEVRRKTPRRLVYCLPMRVLVEQTRDNVIRWLHNLGLLGGDAEFDPRPTTAGSAGPEYCIKYYKPTTDQPDRVAVHVLMGGEDEEAWDIYPEREAIMIGTQDMLLSRALNRGYAASRARWPMHFGLLHTDCLWVFDEIQLMGSGLATTAQLEAFRRVLPSTDAEHAKGGHGCRSVWMSATLRPEWLRTVDFKDRIDNQGRIDGKETLALTGEDHASAVVKQRWNASKPLARATSAMNDPARLANELREAHRPGTRTLIVVNTVERACALFDELSRAAARAGASEQSKRGRKGTAASATAARPDGTSAPTARPKLVLLHSRFRPPDRAQRVADALAHVAPDGPGTIIVSTQVIEAGVDVSVTTLFTELAPWASLVQRFGRCNRRGEQNEHAAVRWIDVPDREAAPYATADLEKSREQLEAIGARPETAQSVGLAALSELEIDMSFDHGHVIRRKDLIDLFDTTPDLAGNDIDIDRFVREIENSDVRVFWRAWDRPKGNEAPPAGETAPRREELCPAPFGEFRDFAKKHPGQVWRWNFLDEMWEKVDRAKVAPGQVFLVHADAGGYTPGTGWDAKSTGRVEPLQPPAADSTTSPDATDEDRSAQIAVWQTIAEHTTEVCSELGMIAEALPLDGSQLRALRSAARWHDWGKAHAVFQSAIDDGQLVERRHGTVTRRTRPAEWAGNRFIAKAPGKRWSNGRLADAGWWRGYDWPACGRKHFRHELASALAVLQRPHDDLKLLSDGDLDLAAYLIAAHHGKVRLSIRSLPNEKRPDPDADDRGRDRRFARGVWDGDALPETNLGTENGRPIIAPAVKLSLEPMELGLCEQPPFAGQPSWAERMIRLRDTLGPFRLAYLEAILRAADMRASKAAAGPGAGA